MAETSVISAIGGSSRIVPISLPDKGMGCQFETKVTRKALRRHSRQASSRDHSRSNSLEGVIGCRTISAPDIAMVSLTAMSDSHDEVNEEEVAVVSDPTVLTDDEGDDTLVPLKKAKPSIRTTPYTSDRGKLTIKDHRGLRSLKGPAAYREFCHVSKNCTIVRAYWHIGYRGHLHLILDVERPVHNGLVATIMPCLLGKKRHARRPTTISLRMTTHAPPEWVARGPGDYECPILESIVGDTIWSTTHVQDGAVDINGVSVRPWRLALGLERGTRFLWLDTRVTPIPWNGQGQGGEGNQQEEEPDDEGERDRGCWSWMSQGDMLDWYVEHRCRVEGMK